MTPKYQQTTLLMGLTCLALLSTDAIAFPNYLNQVPTNLSCATCHVNGRPKSIRNAFGRDFRRLRSWDNLCAIDSDGDDASNALELADPDCLWRPGQPKPRGAQTFPGDAASVPIVEPPPPEPTCNDNEHNGDESDVDCGGTDCAACPLGDRCGADEDCQSNICGPDGVCRPAPLAPTCDDGESNGDETDVDCGGPDCEPCGAGDACRNARDCAPGPLQCIDRVCQPPAPTCEDGVRNGTETDVDCGGDDCGPCAVMRRCRADADCENSECGVDGVCQAAPPMPVCADGIRNGEETDVDCGGPICRPCREGERCRIARDCHPDEPECSVGRCRAAAPTCDDGILNGNETDMDCGGDDCDPCALMSDCAEDADCEEGLCSANGICIPDDMGSIGEPGMGDDAGDGGAAGMGGESGMSGVIGDGGAAGMGGESDMSGAGGAAGMGGESGMADDVGGGGSAGMGGESGMSGAIGDDDAAGLGDESGIGDDAGAGGTAGLGGDAGLGGESALDGDVGPATSVGADAGLGGSTSMVGTPGRAGESAADGDTDREPSTDARSSGESTGGGGCAISSAHDSKAWLLFVVLMCLGRGGLRRDWRPRP